MREKSSLHRPLFFVALLLGLVLVFIFGLYRAAGGRPDLDSAAMLREVQQLHELATVKYSIQKVVGFREQKLPFGNESLLLVVQGKVIAGVDLAALKSDSIQIDGNKVVMVMLPAAKVLHVYLDEKQTQVWDRRVTWWTPWIAPNPDLERQARLEAVKSVEQTGLEMGILAEAERNAQSTLRNLMKSFGVEQVTFRPLS